MDVKALVKTLADRLAEVKAKTLSDTLGHVDAEALAKKFSFYVSRDKGKDN